MSGAPSRSAAVRAVLQHAVEAFRDDPETARWLRGHLDRLDEPLRVAIAGKVKAGKSTLLNALVGDEIAATDAGECTRVVTWYRDGRTPKVTAHPRNRPPQPLPVTREEGALAIDLQGTPAEQLDRLVVDWPSQNLRSTTLVDTPGIASLSDETSGRALTFLTPEDSPSSADAVIYLMRHLHAADAEFLESFRDQTVARAAPVNTVAVLSRADEIGAGRLDALQSARSVARRYRGDPTLRALCQDVVAVAGLLAQAGRTLRQSEFALLTALARASRDELAALLLSAERFLHSDATPVLGADMRPEVRRDLLDRFSLFGIRLSTTLIRQGTDTPSALATELVRRSGLLDLQSVLDTQFTERRDLLKARSALLALETVLHREGASRGGIDTRPLQAEVERILSGTHEFVELRLLNALRTGAVALPEDEASEAERLLGGRGTAVPARLGTETEDPDELRRLALDALSRWQRRAESPLSSRAVAHACRMVARSCEGTLAALNERN